MPTPELLVKNLKVSFSTSKKELIAVRGISYQLNQGEILALVGESGCGKTVSALSILRLIQEPPGKIVSGEILFAGKDLLKLKKKELQDRRGKGIAMIFQDPMTSLNPVLTIGEQIIETLLRHTSLSRKKAWGKSFRLLEQVEIPSPKQKLDQYPHQLSGGMRQRVMIAMALSCSPRILIADEPTTALDVLIQAQILSLLKKIKNDIQMSILLITHDLGVVAEVAERVMVMYAGEIVESGSVNDLFRSPLHPYTIGLMESIPTLESTQQKLSKLKEISGTVPSLSQVPFGCPFHPRCSAAETRCKTDKPKLKKISQTHSVSCWLH
ncbi:MAG: ABC transporter ATP-binding protein [Gammaproteobacteria bacterium]|nr:ABC transporter ATP-binding protein [Gammaproteobacteria bacterium]